MELKQFQMKEGFQKLTEKLKTKYDFKKAFNKRYHVIFPVGAGNSPLLQPHFKQNLSHSTNSEC